MVDFHPQEHLPLDLTLNFNIEIIVIMKKIQKNITRSLAVLGAMMLVLSSCSDDFLERPPEDSFNAEEFFQTDDQIQSSVNILYSLPWGRYVSEYQWVIGELAGGTGRTFDPRNQDFDLFAVTGNHPAINGSWSALYGVIAQANSAINAIPDVASNGLSQTVIDNAKGEARAMRALAYYHLVRIFGSVPIIENNEAVALEPSLPRHIVEDVYTFIKNDLQFAIDNISHTKFSEPGRISSNGAKALLAQVHLTIEEYQQAYDLSSQVIASGEFGLLGGNMEDGLPGTYDDLFLTENDNNPESIIAFQWTTSGTFAEGNAVQSFYALSGITGFSDGFSAIGPSIDLQNTYEDTDLDQRYKATIMEPGAFYPNLNGGYTVSSNQESVNAQQTLRAVKKYVVGEPSFNGGGRQGSYPNNTYALRYADVLLIQAEAVILGGVGAMADAETSINKIRNRAGLPSISNPTFEDVFRERKLEFAFEMVHWFDAIRRDDATTYLSNIERGWFPDATNPTEIFSRMVTVTEDKLLFPYPTAETINNPGLLQEPVPFFN